MDDINILYYKSTIDSLNILVYLPNIIYLIFTWVSKGILYVAHISGKQSQNWLQNELYSIFALIRYIHIIYTI